MTKHNPENERIKRQFLTYQKEAETYCEASVDAMAGSIDRFETYINYRDFMKFHPEQARAFKRHLADKCNERTGEKLSKATVCAILNHLKRFFYWLAKQPGYKSRILLTDAKYFSPSKKDARVAATRREKLTPTLEQIKRVISIMPAETDIQRRNRALIAFTIRTGARVGAIMSAKLKHIDLVAGCFNQDAREVRTKSSKSHVTTWFPVGEEIGSIVENWVTWLRTEMRLGDDDPLFPATLVAPGPSFHYETAGLSREHWATAAPMRSIFRSAFTLAGLPYPNPHSFRSTLALLGQTMCPTIEQYKVWSQNLGHKHMLTTFLSYGEVDARRQAEIMRELAAPRPKTASRMDELVEAVERQLRERHGWGPSGESDRRSAAAAREAVTAEYNRPQGNGVAIRTMDETKKNNDDRPE